nr:helix-turn-helix transcriptional regulator [Acetivibrio straminisolvens]
MFGKVVSKIRTLGEQIRRARIEKGLTQKQLADLLGVKNNSISDWEKGKSKPHVDIIELLMGVLDIDANTLLGWSEPEQRKAEAEALAKQILARPKVKEILPDIARMNDKDLEFLADFIKRLNKEG